MLGDALTYPSEGESWLKRVGIGGLLVLFGGIFFIPILFVYGYLIRVLDRASRGVAEPPAFDEWGNLAIDGLKMFVVTLVFFVVPTFLAVVFGAVAGVFLLDLGGGPGAGGGGGGAVGLLIVAGVALVFLAAAYLLPAALTNMAREDSIGAAFSLGTLASAAASSDYLIAYVLAVVVAAVVGTVAALLSVVLVGIFLLFYVQVSVFYLYGRGFGQAVAGDAAPAEGAARAGPGPVE